MSTLAQFLENQSSEYAGLMQSVALAQWNASTHATDENEATLMHGLNAIRTWSSDTDRYKTLLALMHSDPAGMADPLVARQAVLLRNDLQGNQVSASLLTQMSELEVQLTSAFSKFRATVGGAQVTNNDLTDLLRTHEDPEIRREAWEASKQIGVEAAPIVLNLAGVRNTAARQVGFTNYYAMQMALQEIDETELFAQFAELEHASAGAWQRFKHGLDQQLSKRFHIPVAELRSWHYADPFFQDGPPSVVNLDQYFKTKDLVALTSKYFAAVGMPVDDVIARSDLFERPGKDQHAFCIDIDRVDDIRALCNVRPNARWMDTMLHEFGHAVYSKFTDHALPWLLRTQAHILTTEAMALLSGNLIYESSWLATYAGVPHAEADGLQATLRADVAAAGLVFTRWVFVMSNFERELYAAPEQDLNNLWWDYVERHQHVHRPDGRAAPDWAAKIHFGVAPVYYHNYLLGNMAAAQLRDHLLHQICNGDPQRYVSDPLVGQFLIERCFKPGGTRDWRGWLKHATGGALSAQAYADKLSF